MRVSLIVAMDLGRVIGLDGQMPWHLPADLLHFKRTSVGKPIIMGRKTFESVGRPLPKRINVIVTRQEGYAHEGCLIAHSLEEAIEMVSPCDEIMICGGSGIYAEAISRVDRMYLTQIGHRFDGDTFFPEFDPTPWTETHREEHAADDRNPHPYTFLQLDRVESDGGEVAGGSAGSGVVDS